MSALTAKSKRYFSTAHSDDDYHYLMAVMNIVKEAREKGYPEVLDLISYYNIN